MFTEVTDRSNTGSLKWEKYKGADVVPMWVADMDFKSPEPVVQALKERADHGIFGYTQPYPDLIHTVLTYLRDEHGLNCKEEWLVWLPGLVPALNLICRAFGGAVMTHTPIYPPFLTAPQYSGKAAIRVPLLQNDSRWEMDFDAMEAAVTDETRIFLLSNPHNPVGRVFDPDELSRLDAFAARHDLIVASDEIHCDLVLDPDKRHTPFLNVSDTACRRTIALYAPSKTYNLPGLSCSFAVIPDDSLRNAFNKTARGIITEINAMGYAACEAAYRSGASWRQQLLEQLRRNHRMLTDTLEDRTPEVGYYPQEATYLAWLDLRSLGIEDLASYFEKFGVGLSDGRMFGAPGFLRMNFGCPPALLKKGLDRFTEAVIQARR